MPYKKIFLIILILLLGTFIFLKVEVSGNPDSNFNRTRRFQLGKYSILRTILGLRSAGDARGEYLAGAGQITIVWFAPESENLNKDVINKFASVVEKYTGRTVQAVYGGKIDDATVKFDKLDSVVFGSKTQGSFNGDKLFVFFTTDYSPRPDNELTTTYGESGVVISLNAQRQFLSNFGQYFDNYLLSSLLRGFGQQIGLKQTNDITCIMGTTAGIDGKPLESYGDFTPQDFCQAEKGQINILKASF